MNLMEPLEDNGNPQFVKDVGQMPQLSVIELLSSSQTFKRSTSVGR